MVSTDPFVGLQPHDREPKRRDQAEAMNDLIGMVSADPTTRAGKRVVALLSHARDTKNKSLLWNTDPNELVSAVEQEAQQAQARQLAELREALLTFCTCGGPEKGTEPSGHAEWCPIMREDRRGAAQGVFVFDTWNDGAPVEVNSPAVDSLRHTDEKHWDGHQAIPSMPLCGKCGQQIETPPAVDSLDSAWAAAEKAVPEGWWLQVDGGRGEPYRVQAGEPQWHREYKSVLVYGSTPIEALRNLTSRLNPESRDGNE